MTLVDQARTLSAGFLDRPGAYLHVPFCTRICPFCPYNKVLHDPARVSRYFDDVAQEVDAWAHALEGPFRSLYIGGGTPSLCLDELAAVVPKVPVDGEIAMEVMPSHVDEGLVRRLRALGVGFVSLGVQSFDEGMLRHLGRPNTPADNQRAIERALGHFACLDVDLIFDVGFASAEVLLQDLERCFALGVDQVSTYPLMRFGFTPFGRAPHDAAAEHVLLHEAEMLAARYGYERTTVWTFNKAGRPRYTSITRELYVGLGAGAATYSGRSFWLNHFSPERYDERIERGELPIARTLALPRALSAAYWLFWQAYAGTVSMARYHALFEDVLPLGPLVRLGVRRG